jgi:hypothetical protein
MLFATQEDIRASAPIHSFTISFYEDDRASAPVRESPIALILYLIHRRFATRVANVEKVRR